MKTLFEDGIALLEKTPGTIVDVGGGHGLQKGLEPYRALLGPRCKSLDYDPSTKPDIVGDIMALPFADSSQDAYICMSVLEHVNAPHRAVDELYRTLKPGGPLLAYVPFLIPYHAKEGAYADYFRFTKDAVRYLFARFSSVRMEPSRRFFEAWFYLLPRFGNTLAPFGRFLDRVFHAGDRQVGGYNIIAIK